MMIISAEREQRDHQAVEKPLPVREEAFIQVTRLFILPPFFLRLSKAGYAPYLGIQKLLFNTYPT